MKEMRKRFEKELKKENLPELKKELDMLKKEKAGLTKAIDEFQFSEKSLNNDDYIGSMMTSSITSKESKEKLKLLHLIKD